MDTLTENRVEKFFKKLRSPFKVLDTLFKIILIALILLMLFESFSFLLYKSYKSNKPSEGLIIDILNNNSWVRDYIKEDNSFGNEYTPYLGWKRIPNFHGVYVNVDNESMRKTDNPCSSKDSIRIFVFGGSTTWGSGVQDNSTFPSYLSKYLCQIGISNEIKNFGEGAYVNTQEMIRLQLELRKGNIPDIVIFYDGANDAASTYQNNLSGWHHNVFDRQADFNSRKRLNILQFALDSYSMKVLNRVAMMFGIHKKTRGYTGEQLENDTISVYSNNLQIINTLSREYNFKVFYYWHPTISSKLVLSEDEKNKISKDQVFEGFYQNITKKVRKLNLTEFYDISTIFNKYNNTIFIDDCHVFEQGNEIIAKRISEDVINYVTSNLVKFNKSL